MMKKILLMIICSIFMMEPIYAKDTGNSDNDELILIQEEQNAYIEYDDIQDSIDKNFNGAVNFKEIVGQVLKGEYHLKDNEFNQLILDALFFDSKSNIAILMRILVISIIAAIFKIFSDSFENKQVSEIGYFVVFLVIITMALQSYNLLNESASELVEKSSHFIEALVPSLMAVTVMSGATISSVLYGESLLMVIGIINNFVLKVMMPFLYVLLAFVLINALSDESILEKGIELMKKIYEWTIKIVIGLFVALYGLQSFGVPVADGLISRTAKQSINIVPVVGSTLSQVSDMVLSSGAMIKNAFGIGVIITLILLTLFPVIKIAVIALIYKVAAVITEPIADSRIVDCLSNIGDVCFLLLGTVVLVLLLLIGSIAITLYLTNMLLYIR